MTTTRSRSILAGSLFFLLLMAARTDAGGPMLLHSPGRPYVWPNGGVAIPFNPDQGGLGPLTNAQAIAQTTAALAAWEAIPSATATHVNAGQLALDVDETNFLPFFQPTQPDGLSAIIYDEDGAIFELLFGAGSGVLGFSSPEWVNVVTGEVAEGVAFLNGGSLLGANAFPVDEFLSVQVHELGHYQNLAHTVVNGQVVLGDATGPTPIDVFPFEPLGGRIETMYPFLFLNGGQATPHADDIAMFSTLYPAPTFATSTGTITGRIIATNNRTRVTGVNVIARNVANPFDDAVSAISSDFTDNFASGAPLVGVYTLRGLTPGASYAVFVDEILEGAFSTPPKAPLPGPEEFYNGAGESNDFVADVPTDFTAVVANAGAPVSNIDIIFNRLPPGQPIPLGDDSTFELFPEFALTFCGQTYESVYVNSNGNLTFGTPSFSTGESAAAFLTGPPRIAGVWDDLNPTTGGTVSYAETGNAFTITFSEVPEHPGIGANSFSITLRKSLPGDLGFGLHGGLFSLGYGAVSAMDGLAGYSCGGKVTSGFEVETDLSALRLPFIVGLQKPAFYEAFAAADNDLDGLRFEAATPKPFRDEFEPNDSPLPGPQHHGHLVKLPFNTADRYSALDPLGGDVDFYRFRAKAGEILAIETVPGSPLDTMIGLFDDAGNLLALDDDGGVGGVGSLSRLLVRVPADGIYAVGVTTWPDFDFTGLAGSDFGRYVLSILNYTGTIVPLEDDGSLEVPITSFQFPFQGAFWSSVWLNGNGNLTFGAGDPEFAETVPKLLAGPPRIAPLWDDLSPTNLLSGEPQGLVIVDERPGKFLVHFVAVPEFLSTGVNYFSVQLDAQGGVSIGYGATNRSDALVGVTQGGSVPDPGPTDLSTAWWLSAVGTTYEQFGGSFATYGGTDLSFKVLRFMKP